MKALFVIGAIALLAGSRPAPKESETAKARVAAPEASACAEGVARVAAAQAFGWPRRKCLRHMISKRAYAGASRLRLGDPRANAARR